MSYAVMPLNEWQKIVNSVRAKTGNTEPLLSTQLAAEIDSITVQSEERTIFGDYIQGVQNTVTAEDLKGVTQIAPYAFYYRPLASVELPDSLTNIGTYSFAYSNLKSIKIPNNVARIEQTAFYRCYDLASVDLGNNDVYLGQNCFSDCTSLTSIDISNITSTGRGPLMGAGLTHITFPGTMNTISDFFCQNCTSLASVRIENGVAKINGGAFKNCTSLMEIVCLSTNPPMTIFNSFENVPEDCVIKVPAASLEAYKTATNWSARADYIIAYEE